MNVTRLLRPALAVLAWACAPAPAPALADECRVGRVSDGDTFYCRDGRKVRLIGIDTPELAQGAAGQQAHKALQRLLPSGAVARLELDAAPRDRYGRTLAHVWIDDRLVNETMVLQGWALLYTVPPNLRYVRRLERAQQQARTRRAGLWAVGGFACAPADFRRRACAR